MEIFVTSKQMPQLDHSDGLLVVPEAPRWQLSWMVFRWFCLCVILYAGKDICTKATMYMAVMSTETEENGIQSMNI